jgi:hypothetical protein
MIDNFEDDNEDFVEGEDYTFVNLDSLTKLQEIYDSVLEVSDATERLSLAKKIVQDMEL